MENEANYVAEIASEEGTEWAESHSEPRLGSYKTWHSDSRAWTSETAKGEFGGAGVMKFNLR